MTLPLHLDTDPPRWREEIEALERMGLNLRRCSEHHLKIGEVNYYPSTGRIYIDPARKYPEKGFKALLRAIEEVRDGVRENSNIRYL